MMSTHIAHGAEHELKLLYLGVEHEKHRRSYRGEKSAFRSRGFVAKMSIRTNLPICGWPENRMAYNCALEIGGYYCGE